MAFLFAWSTSISYKSEANVACRYDDRGGGERYGGYRNRPRSRSPRRRSSKEREYREKQHSPRNYDRPRSPHRHRSRSPHGRDRSPPRSRNDTSQYRERSPPRPARYQDDRHGRRDYPPRDGPRRFPMENNYRPNERARSPPRRSAHVSHDESPRSQPLSRRASPPPERVRTPPRESGYGDRNDRERYGRERSPSRGAARSPPREMTAHRERTPARKETSYHERSPPRQQDKEYLPDAEYEKDIREQPHYDDLNRQGPPTGPSYRGESVSGDSRNPRQPLEPVRGGHHGNGSHRQVYEEAPNSMRSGSRPVYDDAHHSSRWPSQNHNQGQPRWENNRNTAPAFRGSSNSTSTTYPRTQRFNPVLSGIGTIVEGGRKQPSLMDTEHEKKLQQLEDDKRKLEAAIDEKQRKKRSDLRDWDKLEREAKSSQLRSELAEGHLERLSEIGAATNY